MKTLKFKTVLTYTGGEVVGYMEKKTLECGSWTLDRCGKYVDMGYENTTFIYWAGDWEVIRNDEVYGTFKTKKEAVRYIQNWITINPKDL